MASSPRDDEADGERDSHEERRRQPSGQHWGGRAKAEAATPVPPPSPSLLRQWTDLLTTPPDWLSPASCGSACLDQIHDDGGGGGVDVTSQEARVIGGGGSGTQGQGQVEPVGDFSLLDCDESTAAPSRDESARDDGAVLDAPDMIVSIHYVRSSHRRGESRTSSPFNSPSSRDTPSSPSGRSDGRDVGVEVSTNESCPICLHQMSPFDVLHPIECPRACGYNFCSNCMNSLLISSREDYQLASDGSRQVKVRLNCPNCRADISNIIEDVIWARQEAHMTVHGKRPAEQQQLLDKLDERRTCSSWNRSRAPSLVRKKRMHKLIEQIESMPAPLCRIGQRGGSQDSATTASLIDDALSQNSLSSVDVQVVQPPPASSPISSPMIYSSCPTDKAEASALSISSPIPSRARSFARLHSPPQLAGVLTPIGLRRIKSLHTPPSKRLSFKKASPKSVFDLDYYSFDFGDQSVDTGAEGGSQIRRPPSPLGVSSGWTAHSPPPSPSPSRGIVCLEGINFEGGEGGFFSSAIDLGWCCGYAEAEEGGGRQQGPPPPGPAVKSRDDCCGGYIDYSGKYYPCTNVGGGNNDERAAAWDGQCQGCIFQQGVHDGSEGDHQEEDLYYDSDPGQHFAVSSWTCPGLERACDDGETAEGSSDVVAKGTSFRRRAKLRWRRDRRNRGKSGRKGRRKSSSGAKAADVVSGSKVDRAEDSGAASDIRSARQTMQADSLERRQEDQQSYLYDYFSRNARAGAMQTGVVMTEKTDVGGCVQEALNSKWRLQWHVGTRGGSQGHLLPKVCDVWIERGYRRNRTEIVEPRLMWRELSQPDLHERRQLGRSTIRPYRVSLFAVRRIFQVAASEDLERMDAGHEALPRRRASLPPMARPNCLLLVRSSLGEDYIFEASRPEERDHIVHLWKITTARLVSHAVVGNGNLLIREFFNEDLIAGGLDTSPVSMNDE